MYHTYVTPAMEVLSEQHATSNTNELLQIVKNPSNVETSNIPLVFTESVSSTFASVRQYPRNEKKKKKGKIGKKSLSKREHTSFRRCSRQSQRRSLPPPNITDVSRSFRAERSVTSLARLQLSDIGFHQSFSFRIHRSGYLHGSQAKTGRWSSSRDFYSRVCLPYAVATFSLS